MTPFSLPLTWNEGLSGALGSISLAAWIFLLLPQLAENYRQGSADGISLTFLLIWFVGDVTNLAGSIWAGLVPTVTALAVYFCFADAVLIGQCFYYRRVNQIKGDGQEQGEREALLGNGHLNGDVSNSPDGATRKHSITDITSSNLGLPGSRRRSSAASRRRTNSSSLNRSILASTPENPPAAPAQRSAWLKNSISVLLVMVAGAAGWAIAWQTGAWTPTPIGDEGGDHHTPIGAEVLGYISAVCYLGARIPQIVKNQRERSCDGLSLLFFLLSLLGNATYGGGILFHSLRRSYVLTNLPWLIGSLGTMAEDAIIFLQFSTFGEKEEEDDDTQEAIVEV